VQLVPGGACANGLVVYDIGAISKEIGRDVVIELDGANINNIPADGGVAWRGWVAKALHWGRHTTFGTVLVLRDKNPARRETAKHMVAGQSVEALQEADNE
jgi:hypothetical protein